MSLTFEERKKKILSQMAIHENVQVNVLAEELGVSTETIRRDLDRLDKEDKLARFTEAQCAILRPTGTALRAEERDEL